VRLVAYLRVSTDRQAEEGLGLEVQEQAIRSWARTHKHRVVLWARDEGVSGSNGLDTREGLLDALSALKEGAATGLVVFRLDRLARDLMVQETLLAELRKLKVDVFSTSPAETAYITDDDADPSRKLIRQVLGAVAEYEKAMVVLRLRMGRERKQAKGGYAYGSPPFGWKAERGQLVPDAEEQQALALIRRMRAEGASYRAIGEALTERGYKPKGKATRKGSPTSGRWHPETLRKIVLREAADRRQAELPGAGT
jgi:DNA invertase Pin-like site-specific DNA recombinase